VGGREFCLTIPAVPDALLDDPAAQAASLADDRMPYWAFVWPSALPMAAAVLDTSWDPRLPVLELGCGTGLVGLAALSRGHHVTFTDYEPRAVALARYNAEQNGFTRFTAHELDWRTPMNEQYPLILGCDLLYQESAFQPLLKLLEQMLPPGGECWLGDGGRSAARWFLHHARERGFEVEIRGANGQMLENPASDFQMFVVRRNS
jgi:predicted nicotinamide N-methyase